MQDAIAFQAVKSCLGSQHLQSADTDCLAAAIANGTFAKQYHGESVIHAKLDG